MIHLFQSGRRLLFFPRAWANSVTNWLLGLHSPNGTLRIVNTATPAEGKGASIDVDMEHVSNDLKERLHNHFTTAKDVNRQIERAADGSTIVTSGGKLGVSEDFLAAYLAAHESNDADQPTAPSSPTDMFSSVPDSTGCSSTADTTSKSFTSSGNGGAVFLALSSVRWIDDYETLFYFRKVTVAEDGRIASISAETYSFSTNSTSA